MPTYDYVCSACGHAFEQFQGMSAKKLRTCPKCKKPALERQVGAGAGLIFKGSGFYITDYKKSGSAAPADKAPASEPACTPPPGGCGQPACPGGSEASSGGGHASGPRSSEPAPRSSKPSKAPKKG